MADMLSPGVYISELDYSEYVSAASTCIIGMVGGARRGPVGVPTLVTSQSQLISIFGNPSELDYGVYSALAALTQTSQLYYTRVVRGGIKASAGVLGINKITYEAIEYGTAYNGIKISQTAPSDDGLFSITVFNAEGEELEKFENVTVDGTAANNIEVAVNGISNYIKVTVQYSGSILEMDFTLAGGDGTGSYAIAGDVTTDKIAFRSRYFDSDINGCQVVISNVDNYGYFDITLKDVDGTIESFASVTLDENSDRYITNIVNSSSTRLIVLVSDKADVEFTPNTLTFSGGDDGMMSISSFDIIGEKDNTGLYSFSNPETIDIDILCAPGWSDVEVVNAGIAVAEGRTDCIYIVDTPFGLSAQEVVDWTNGTGSYTHNGFDSSYAACYWPWVKISDSYTSKNKWMPPSGYIAAQIAYNDSVGHPWFAPAGLNRGQMIKPIGLELSPTPGERNAVYGNRNVVNPLVNFLGEGVTIWGQKTMQRKPSALDRINVRRLMNYLKKTIGLAVKYYVFEQNDETAWDSLNDMVEPTLRSIKEQRGLYDYKIEIAPTKDDVENNVLPITVGVQPTKSAEFIPLTFKVMPTSASFEDEV